MAEKDKPLVWLHDEVKTPPFSEEARLKAGFSSDATNFESMI